MCFEKCTFILLASRKDLSQINPDRCLITQPINSLNYLTIAFLIFLISFTAIIFSLLLYSSYSI